MKSVRAIPGRPILWSRKGRTVIEFWRGKPRRGKPTRWYWHKRVNGEVVASGSYAYRSTVRRALLHMFGPETS